MNAHDEQQREQARRARTTSRPASRPACRPVIRASYARAVLDAARRRPARTGRGLLRATSWPSLAVGGDQPLMAVLRSRSCPLPTHPQGQRPRWRPCRPGTRSGPPAPGRTRRAARPPGSIVALLFWMKEMIAAFSSGVSWPSPNFGMFSGPDSMAPQISASVAGSRFGCVLALGQGAPLAGEVVAGRAVQAEQLAALGDLGVIAQAARRASPGHRRWTGCRPRVVDLLGR